MKIALAQIDTTVGDLVGNVERCLEAVGQARRQQADLVVLPEMAIPGYPPRDILYDRSFIEAAGMAAADLAERAKDGPAVIVGSIAPSDYQPPLHAGLHSAALLMHGGTMQTVANKQILPAYDVFHEPRWFIPGPVLPPLAIAGKRIGVLICEDLWDEGYDRHPPADLIDAGADLLIAINASPYRPDAMSERLYHARRHGCPVVFVNLVGGNDELIFDGRSFVVNGSGEIVARLAAFEEETRTLDLDGAEPVTLAGVEPQEEIYRALTLGIRDFARKNGIERAFLGLSGGIDSALTAILTAEAMGSEQVTGIAIPSRYTDPRSTACARELAGSLGIWFEVVELESLHAAAESTLRDLLDEGTTAENIQARLRMLILMGYVNRCGGMLINTSNKTELSLGYSTIYGDMAGTLCPIADLTKPQVYALAEWIQAERGIIPAYTLERAPSAELRPGQVDPFDYPAVGPALDRLVRENRSNVALRRSEHKRWQMGVVLKVSDKAFGTGRMIPITRR